MHKRYQVTCEISVNNTTKRFDVKLTVTATAYAIV